LASSYQCETGVMGGEVATKMNRQRYAVKFLRSSVKYDRRRFERGAADLAIEAKLLSALDHPNIIKLHGIAAGDVEQCFASGRERSFFLILDRLYDTLEDRIETWSELSARYSSLSFRFVRDARGCKRRSLMIERMQCARDLASAVEYLHNRNVVFRDIKPENVGFYAKSILKLFDFGLSKELKPSRRLADGTYRLTGNTGSRRYMAPEVAMGHSYGFEVDSYSFGILLWEICALEKPFLGFSEARHAELVVEGGHRPPIDAGGQHSHWPERVRDLMVMCWNEHPYTRPNFTFISNELQTFLDEEAIEQMTGLLGSPSSFKSGRKKRIGSFSAAA